MGKIYMKTKYDRGMKMEIPHSFNIANAMYGFRELGAEIIPYHSIDDIYDIVEKEDIVLDYILQCNEIFGKFGVKPRIPDYPDVLVPFLGRKIWKDTINTISSDEKKWSAGYFVKPTKSKVFTGKIIKSLSDLVGCGNQDEDYEVLVSEPLEICGEWRCFITYDELVDVRPYGMLLDRKSYLYQYDVNVLNSMMDEFRKWEERPMACSMDICVTKDGRTLLVELNDAYALGCYGLPSISYAKLISARWSQLLNVNDEYRF
ncbi:MAG: ATP-grasp domain-containing protein [Clostridia bacterium]|nr:ATP-grasp domain-containing protein [Clostridia bacterium]